MLLRVILLYNEQKISISITQEIITFLIAHSIQVDSFLIKEIDLLQDASSYQLAISVGGDGTTLRASRYLLDSGIPLFAVNAGSVGFITKYAQNEWQEGLKFFLSGVYQLSKRYWLEIRHFKQNDWQDGVTLYALNEAMITADQHKLWYSEIFINQEFVGSIRAEGVMVSTPIGSTGHALSISGVIVEPNTNVLLLNTLASTQLSARPLIFSDSKEVSIQITASKYPLSLFLDGQIVSKEWSLGDRVSIMRSSRESLWVENPNSKLTFYRALELKLGWLNVPRE